MQAYNNYSWLQSMGHYTDEICENEDTIPARFNWDSR